VEENVGLNKVANSLWIGEQLFPQHIISINSFLQNGFQYNLYVYGEVKNIPSGVNVLDGNDMIPKEEIWYYQKGFNKGSPSGFSNQFRFTLLAIGGLWVDTDVVLLKNFNLDKPYIFISERNINGDIHPTSSVIYSESGTSSGKIWSEAIDNISYRNKARVIHGETGPELVTYLVKKYNLHDYVLPPNAFCAIGWHESDKLVDGTLLPNDVVGLHLFDSQSNLNDIDKKTYPHNSIIEGLKRKYL
jgi:hypothetical protein|tara:strand:+ start:855 stop:1589 length:735 start_codon:yes stop_codon:yes gene_type:complete